MTSYESEQRVPGTPEQIWQLLTTPADFSWRSQVSSATDQGHTYSETSSVSRWPATYTVTEETVPTRRVLDISHVDGDGTRAFELTPVEPHVTLVRIAEEFHFNGPKHVQPLMDEFMENQQAALLRDLVAATAATA